LSLNADAMTQEHELALYELLFKKKGLVSLGSLAPHTRAWWEACRSRSSCAGYDFKSMEPLWSTLVAKGREPTAPRLRIAPAKTLQTVASACHQLPPRAHGKEGVNGSSPLEGSAKAPEIGAFL
jgi:hypothetical protein